MGTSPRRIPDNTITPSWGIYSNRYAAVCMRLMESLWQVNAGTTLACINWSGHRLVCLKQLMRFSTHPSPSLALILLKWAHYITIAEKGQRGPLLKKDAHPALLLLFYDCSTVQEKYESTKNQQANEMYTFTSVIPMFTRRPWIKSFEGQRRAYRKVKK